MATWLGYHGNEVVNVGGPLAIAWHQVFKALTFIQNICFFLIYLTLLVLTSNAMGGMRKLKYVGYILTNDNGKKSLISKHRPIDLTLGTTNTHVFLFRNKGSKSIEVSASY